jgi:SAM-dependent methyltransferase
MMPSSWVQRWSHLVVPGGRVLDVACGSGRHARWFAERGHPVTAVDRDVEATAALHAVAEVINADIEDGPWPLGERRFDAIVVTNYLWRPLLPLLLERLAVGGVLLYETFAEGQATVGRPTNPEFLLRTGELLAVAGGLHVVAYENGFLDGPPRFVQRLAAVQAHFSGERPVRYPLAPTPAFQGGAEGG